MKSIDDMTDEELAHAMARRNAIKAATAKSWPRRLKMYAHTPKVFETDEGSRFLAETKWTPTEASAKLRHISAELALEFEVNQDGSSRVVSIDGKPWIDAEEDIPPVPSVVRMKELARELKQIISADHMPSAVDVDVLCNMVLGMKETEDGE